MGFALVLAVLAANPPLTVAERAQLAVPLIEATRVVRQALAAKEIRCVPAAPFDESKPENWVPPEPATAPGLRQPYLWSKVFNCSSALGVKQLAVQIYESAAAAPKDKLLASGPGFYLRDFGDYAQLGVGSLVLFDANGALPEPSPPPEGRVFHGPRAITVDAEAAAWLQWIPTRALLTVLERATLPAGARPKPLSESSSPRPAPEPSARAPASDRPLPLDPTSSGAGAPIAESIRGERRAEVRRMVLESFVSETTRQIVVADRTSSGFEARMKSFLLTSQPEFDRSAIDDFALAVAQSRPLASIEFRVPVRLITAAELDQLFPRDGGGDGWVDYRVKFPDASPIIHLSEVGLSLDGNQAMIAIDWQGDWLVGAGETWLLRRTEKGWEKVYVLRRWVS